MVGGKLYAVEASGGDVWLIDLATDRRFLSERCVAKVAQDSIVRQMYPTAFVLD